MKMNTANRKISFRRALTLMELVIAMAMITIIFAAVLPQFEIIRKSWDVKQGIAEALQNGRVLMDHISRNLSRAKQITAVTASSIDFNDCNGFTFRYDVNTNNYVEYGPVGSCADLAGPVSSLTFTCYDACDVEYTDVNDIRIVKVVAAFTNSASPGRDQTFTTWVYLRVNSQSEGCWSDEDIGAVAATGSATFADCNWTVVGSGVDIWDFADGFHYVYQSLSGDGQIVARVVSMTNTDPWAKAGVMIRETLDTASKHAMMVVTPGNGTAFQRRTSTGGISTHTDGPGGTGIVAPYWVKLIRRGNTFTGYDSADGSNWNTVDTDTVSMATDVYIGLCVTSHNDGALCTADFNNVSFLTYEGFNENNASSDTTFITINTPATNTGDLLIAAVATDGDTSGSLAPAVPANWTAINVGSWSGQVTLGAWRRFSAGASEPASHTFTWTGVNQQAYGWMMRFTGCDPTNPINGSPVFYGESSQYPTSPAVNTTVGCSMILRLGAFDDDSITVDAPGLSGHSPITMDKSATSGIWSVGILGSWVPTLTHAKESGSNRALVFIAHVEDNDGAINLSAVTYGGGPMTKVIDITSGASGTREYVVAYILNEAGIAAATSPPGTFNVNWGSNPPDRVQYYSVFLRNVNQAALIVASASNATLTGATITTAALATSNGDMVIDAATNGGTGNYTVNNSFVEAYDLGVAQFDGVAGYKPATGVNETPSVTHQTNNNRQALIGFVVRGIVVSGTVSGGAGYVRQSAAGPSGPSNFSLLSSKDARMLTIAIAPDGSKCDACSENQIIP